MSVPMSPLQAVMRERVAAGLPPLASTPSADVTDEQLESLWRERVGSLPTGVVSVDYDPTFTGDVVFWAEHGGVRREQRRTREQFDDDPDLGYATVRALVGQVRDVVLGGLGETLTRANPSIGRTVDPTALADFPATELHAEGTPGQQPVLAAATRGMLTPLQARQSHGLPAADPPAQAGILDRIDDTLTYYSAGLGGEVTVPVERGEYGEYRSLVRTNLLGESHHPHDCADQFTVLLRRRRGAIRRRYCYAVLLGHHRDEHDRVQVWLSEHGIDPATVPLDTLIVVDGPARTLRVRVHLRDEVGRIYLAPDGDEVAQATVTVRLRSPWPLADMPRGESPRTRRWWWRQEAGPRSRWERHTYSPAAVRRMGRERHHQPPNMAHIHIDYHRRHR